MSSKKKWSIWWILSLFEFGILKTLILRNILDEDDDDEDDDDED